MHKDITFQKVSDIIRGRRAIFPNVFVPGELTRETLLALLENANWAPTHKHTEPWRFKVLQGRALEHLGQYLADAYKAGTPVERFSDRKYQKKLSNPVRSAAVLAICLYRDPEERVPEWEELASLACAVQNIWLSLESLGLGGYWSTPEAILGRPSILPLEEHERCYGIFYIGFVEHQQIQSKRSPVEDKIMWFDTL